MNPFELHTQESAPEESKSLLAGIEKAYGFIPNVSAILAESPATLKAYMTVSKILEQSSLSPAEAQVAFLTINEWNACHYCVAAHSAIAGMKGVPDEVVGAIRNGQKIPDARLEALRLFTSQVLDKRGWVSTDEIAAFIDAGFSKAYVLDVILAVALKTISNYANHIADTPLDEAFKNHAWTARGNRDNGHA